MVPTATMRPPAARVLRDRRRGGRVDRADFGMHAWSLGILGLDRQEGAGADMQGDGDPRDAARLQGRQQRGREMETGGRRGHGAVPGREDRLVVGAVAFVGPAGPLDIGRQRHATDRGQRRHQFRAAAVEGQLDLAALALRGDRRPTGRQRTR